MMTPPNENKILEEAVCRGGLVKETLAFTMKPEGVADPKLKSSAS
jgi:hypothetical protein